jgi:hypothetical protein
MAAAFKFFTTISSDGTNTTNFTGVASTVASDALDCKFDGAADTTVIGATNGTHDNVILARTEMLQVLANEVFGSTEAYDLFRNNTTVIDSFNSNMSTILGDINAQVDGNQSKITMVASVEMVNSLLNQNAPRFELAYNSGVFDTTSTPASSALENSATYGGVDHDNDTLTENTLGLSFTTGGVASDGTVVVETTSAGAVLRITSLVSATTTPVVKGDELVISIPASTVYKDSISSNNSQTLARTVTITSVNSVQAAMLNGTLEDSGGTEVPLELDDILRLKITMNSKPESEVGAADGQTNASGDQVSVAYTAYADFKAI